MTTDWAAMLCSLLTERRLAMGNGLPYTYGSGSYGAMNPNDIAAVILPFFACIAVIALVFVVFQVWLYLRIFSKAGYSGWMGLLCLVPAVGPLVCLLILAFDTWPIARPANPYQVQAQQSDVQSAVPAVQTAVPLVEEESHADEV